MPYVSLNPSGSFASVFNPFGYGNHLVTGESLGSTGGAFSTAIGTNPPPELAFASPQVVLASAHMTAGNYYFMQYTLSGPARNPGLLAQIQCVGYTWTATVNSTGGVGAILQVASGSSGTTINVGGSPITEGYATSGVIQIFHGTAGMSNCLTYAYTGITSSSFTGCTPVSSPALIAAAQDIGVQIPGTLANLTLLSVGDCIVQYYTAPTNALIVSAAAYGEATQNPGAGSASATTVEIQCGYNFNVAVSANLVGSIPTYPSVAVIASGFCSVNGVVPAPSSGEASNGAAFIPGDGALYALILWNALQHTLVEQEMRFPALTVTTLLSYRPTVSVTVIGLVSGSISIPTTSPNIIWNYNSPDGYAQKTYRIVIFKTSDTALTGFNINDPSNYAAVTSGLLTGTQTWGTAGVTPVYDSGDVLSSLPLASIPAGALLGGLEYRIFVFVSDNSGPTVYPVMVNTGTTTALYGGINAGVDIMTYANPILMPGMNTPTSPGSLAGTFNPATGLIGPIAVRARQNILTAADADLGAITGQFGPFGWAYDSSQSVGTGTAPLIGVQPGNDFYPNQIYFSKWGTQTTSIAAVSGAVSCLAGEMLTATIKAKLGGAGTTPFTGKPYISFYNAAGTLIETVMASTGYSIPGLAGTTTVNGNPGLFILQAMAPSTAAYAVLGFQATCTPTTLSGAVFVTLYEPSLTVNCINIIDDASFNTRLIGDMTTGSIIEDAAWSAEEKGTNPAAVVITDTGPSYVFGTSAASMGYTSTATINALHTSYLVPSLNGDTGSYLMAADLKSTGSLSAQMGMVSTTAAAVTTTTETLTAAWARFTTKLTSGLVAPGYFGFVIPTTAAVGGIEIDNVQVERVWTFTDGSFDHFTGPFNVPLTVAFGDYGSGISTTQPGQWWQALYSYGTTGSSQLVQILATGGQAGANFASIKNAAMTQYFTVSGLTSISGGFYYQVPVYTSGAGATAYLQFFDASGIQLNSNTVLLTPVKAVVGSWTNKTFTTIAVPLTAAYACITFDSGAGATMLVDTVTVTLNGTLAPSSPWLDGGWSQGGLAPTATTTLQREENNSGVYVDVRIPPFTLAQSAQESVGGPGYEWDFQDYEYMGSFPGNTWTMEYFANNGSGQTQSPYNALAISNTNGFVVSAWLLIDPLFGGNITLAVKDHVDFTTDENQTVLMPMGTGRKVVLGDSKIFGDTITLPCLTTTGADFRALQAMYSKTYPLLLKSPDGETWFVRATKRQRTRTWQGSYASRILRTYTLTFEQVAAIP